MNSTEYTRTKKVRGHTRKSCPDLKKNDGKESERPSGGQKRAAPKQWGRLHKRVAVEPLPDDMGKQKERGRKGLPNSQCQYCKHRGHKPECCPALKMRLEKKKEATKQDKVRNKEKTSNQRRRFCKFEAVSGK
ncbi:OLC1v1015706C1 [Oldenlandia corymbosa var. corymbosa]|uniref:OLC1v1015706C1 n=1 Tax=Oldenlandia corymbosa var. corymbosa TaxID=529605 RepID=A0AAV1E4R3_OLDCO|nr:OLC1v1015706C1 [Oldenlandia corymbosa var. corymbosa]